MTVAISRSFGEVTRLAADLLSAAGLASRKALLTARTLAVAEAWGLPSHGLLRLPTYLSRTKAGGYPTDAELVVVSDTGPLVVFDGGGGLGHWQIFDALEHLYSRAGRWGIAGAAIANSGHCGALGVYAASAVQQGYASLVFSSGPPAMPPWGGTAKLLSTSPIAAAFPHAPRPILIDMAMSTVARGTIAAHALRGEPLQEGWAFDSYGQRTTDPMAALSGMLAPAGGPKGYALAFMVEALTAGLVGPALSSEQPDFFDARSFGALQGIAHLILLIDPAKTVSPETPRAAIDRLAELVYVAESAGGRAPGNRRPDIAELTDDYPLNIDAKTWAIVSDLNPLTQ